MLGLIGIRKNVDINIRERLAIALSKQSKAVKELNKLYEEVVIISTCNRTEIYISGCLGSEKEIRKIFEVLDWDISLLEYTFYLQGISVAKHLLEVVCGFHSKILGEDQILGQVKLAYELSLENKAIHTKLLRLFEEAISCGKKFRTESKLYEIPVSASSIAVNEVEEFGADSVMVLGYGTIGSLVVKYALGSKFKKVFIVVRNKGKVPDLKDDRVKILDFNEYKEVINEVDAVISCTAAPHIVIKDAHINKDGKEIMLIDLALPRDIDETLSQNKRVTLLDIDTISKLDGNNKKLRNEKMNEYKFLVDEYLNEYRDWLNIREVTYYIHEIKNTGNSVVESRAKSFENKCKDKRDIDLATTLIKSTSDYYINRAIKLLKEEKLKGREEECLNILKQIFMEN
ncbi:MULTISPECIES: glutamyl-tRNA reductase [unclassified Clostridium]|uniref:glutamyl-tRNA reductase n=1 Tax=unclassified Clostridium TaxID=2614128 RepID=UPI001897D76C|nr:glutamyl-tRNA reductase [Clostridium sp.]MBP3915003.1 glutamyl-tRNA reductase [Clostridium sp.]